jgi:hypothetical protein
MDRIEVESSVFVIEQVMSEKMHRPEPALSGYLPGLRPFD